MNERRVSPVAIACAALLVGHAVFVVSVFPVHGGDAGDKTTLYYENGSNINLCTARDAKTSVSANCITPACSAAVPCRRTHRAVQGAPYEAVWSLTASVFCRPQKTLPHSGGEGRKCLTA